MGKQEKVPCPKCGMLYAWNASKKRVRNHGSCQFDPPVQKKPGFRVIVAPARNESNVYVPQVSVPPRAPVVSAREKEDLEEFYRQNILENERLSREAKARHEIFLKEKAARDEEMITITTPFDEPSVEMAVDHKIQIIKVASCSCTDWPLLENIADTKKTSDLFLWR